MAQPTILKGGNNSVKHASNVYQEAFRQDPVINYMLCNLTESARHEYLCHYFDALLTAAEMNGAIFHQADEWSSCSVLRRPGQRIDNFWTLIPAGILGIIWTLGFGGYRRMIMEFSPMADAAKTRGLKGQTRYYYVFFVGTADRAQGQGLGSALMRELQDVARKDGLPLWLEATTESSRRLYERLGFEIVEQMTLGTGEAAADGSLQKGGEGVPVWGMIWWPRQSS